jgi:8-oxo-dGTP diphosphatase
LAFDHDTIVGAAIERARAKLEYTTLATSFLPERFTLSDLRRVYEDAWRQPIHHANFARKVLAVPGFLVEVDGKDYRATYRAGPATRISPPFTRSQAS